MELELLENKAYKFRDLEEQKAVANIAGRIVASLGRHITDDDVDMAVNRAREIFLSSLPKEPIPGGLF
jgi:hypothetical protein